MIQEVFDFHRMPADGSSDQEGLGPTLFEFVELQGAATKDVFNGIRKEVEKELGCSLEKATFQLVLDHRNGIEAIFMFHEFDLRFDQEEGKVTAVHHPDHHAGDAYLDSGSGRKKGNSKGGRFH